VARNEAGYCFWLGAKTATMCKHSRLGGRQGREPHITSITLLYTQEEYESAISDAGCICLGSILIGADVVRVMAVKICLPRHPFLPHSNRAQQGRKQKAEAASLPFCRRRTGPLLIALTPSTSSKWLFACCFRPSSTRGLLLPPGGVGL
jgi:hypothetical protein